MALSSGGQVHNESGQDRKIDEIADQLDDVKTAVDELDDDIGPDKAVRRLKDAVERASDAADDVEDVQG